jgi:hypothetical protein
MRHEKYTHFRDEIFGEEPDTDAWEAKMTGKQKVGMAVIALLVIGLLALSSHYNYWWMANFN